MDIKTFKRLIFKDIYLQHLIIEVLNDWLQQGLFPDVFKIGQMVPVFKIGEKHDRNNYRPVMPCMSKILETIIKNRLVDYFESQSIYTYKYYGFRAGRSTTAAITNVIDFVLVSWQFP